MNVLNVCDQRVHDSTERCTSCLLTYNKLSKYNFKIRRRDFPLLYLSEPNTVDKLLKTREMEEISVITIGPNYTTLTTSNTCLVT